MIVAEFIKLRQADWTALEQQLLGDSRALRFKRSPEEISLFASLFRSACADLERARAMGYPDDLVDYLNTLTARGHNVFYAAPPFPPGRIRNFFTHLFPLTVRRNAVYVSAGMLLFFGPLLGMIVLSTYNDDVLFRLIPKETLEQAEKMYAGGHAQGRDEGTDVAMTGFYVRNNIGIAFQCFASGIFFGLGSIFLLVFNGISIGAVVGFLSHSPVAMNLLSFIVGHGPFELTAISIAGAAGLRLGFGPIITGHLRRSHALRLAAKDAVVLVLGAAALLLGAALIEGFFSPSSLPMVVKFIGGGICALFLVWYLGLYRVPVTSAGQEPA